ncbi:MAG: Flp pilus assembly complex ATPase component TadA, partial [Candidatus Abyssubacteria bacterium]|nr:Flp pilus assembly complex ATPase component TadA [Candidatus Abyssubacteria bacterium]
MSQDKQKKRLGEILIDSNRLLPEQLEMALAKQRESGRRLGQILLEMGFVSYEVLVDALTLQTGIPHLWLRKGLVDPKVVNIVPKEKAELYSIMPMFKVHNTLTMAMSDPSAIFIMDDLESVTGCRVQPVRCRKEDIAAAIVEYYGKAVQMETFLESFGRSDDEAVKQRQFEDLRMVEDTAEGARTINIVNHLLLNAIKERASDVHIEPDIQSVRVRYRIDGVLQEVMTPPLEMLPGIVSRVKVMANMDIGERRLPQDGRLRVVVEGRDVDLRVSSMPTILGEKVVMRLLDKSQLVLDMHSMGFHPDTLDDFERLLLRPHGII